MDMDTMRYEDTERYDEFMDESKMDYPLPPACAGRDYMKAMAAKRRYMNANTGRNQS